MNEPGEDWTKMKWLIRHNFVMEQLNKRAEREARFAKRRKNGARS
jgi:hypothetical protein